MSVSIIRGILGATAFCAAAAVWNGPSLAADPPYEPSTYDSYVADPAESYVVETDGLHDSEPAAQAPVAVNREADYCREEHPVTGSGNTLCEQADGSLHMVATEPDDGVAAESFRPLQSGARTASQYCREYQQTIVADGHAQPAYGTACWQPDGSWQIVTPATLRDVPVRSAVLPERPVPRFFFAPDYPAPAPRVYPQPSYSYNPPAYAAPRNVTPRYTPEAAPLRTTPAPVLPASRPLERRPVFPAIRTDHWLSWLHPRRPEPKRSEAKRADNKRWSRDRYDH